MAVELYEVDTDPFKNGKPRPNLYDHQKIAVEKLSTGKVLRGGVGVGKSRTAIAYYVKNESQKNLLIITTAKKRDCLDWEEECSKWGIGKIESETLYGTIIIDSWQNIKKYETITGVLLIADEQKLSGKGEWVKSFQKIAKNNSWIMLSATPGDNWLDFVPLFVANGFYKNRTEFLNEHVIFKSWAKFPTVDRFVGVNKLVRLRHEILVEMPYLSEKERIIKYVAVDHDKELFKKSVQKRWNFYKNKPMKDVAELFRVMRRIVNSDPSRLSAVCTLMEAHPKIIVFYNFDYELEILRKLNDTVCVREFNGHKHEELPLGEDNWVYLVNYLSGSEGWNCVETNAIIFYSLTYSYKNFHQAMGRIDRINSKYMKLYYYPLVSDSKIDRMIRNALEKKHNFSEKRAVL